MNSKRLTFLLVAVYVIGIIISAYTILNLENRLVYDLQVLQLSDTEQTSNLFYTVYAILGVTFLLGLLSIYYTYKSEESAIIYVEKTKEEKDKEKQDRKEANEEKKLKIERSKLNTFGRSMEDQKNLTKLLNFICNSLDATQGAIYKKLIEDDIRKIELQAAYAMSLAESEKIRFEFGEGLVGQVAKEQKSIILNDVPEGYIKIHSGLGESSPKHLMIIPITEGSELTGVLEISAFTEFTKGDIKMLEEYFRDFEVKSTTKKNKSSSSAKDDTGKDKKELMTVEADAEKSKKETKNKKKTGDK